MALEGPPSRVDCAEGFSVSGGVGAAGERGLRSPEPFGDLQVNFCRNPACPNFGVPASPFPSKSGQNDPYKLQKGGKRLPDRDMRCKGCGKEFRLKSNKAIAAEIARISRYMTPGPEPCCPGPGCPNRAHGVYTAPDAYQDRGERNGVRRFRCRACKLLFSVPERSTHRQRKPHLNRMVFAELVTKKPIRGIAEVTGLDPHAVYDKIDFIHRQCLRFAGERESRLEGMKHKALTLCVDAQDYMINWRSRVRRKNIQFSALCTVEAKSGYVLAHTMNYDPDINQGDVEDEAKIHGDLDPSRKSYFRASPQYWLENEFAKMSAGTEHEIRPNIEAEPLYIDALIEAIDGWEAELCGATIRMRRARQSG
jgi:transposase-like protein